MDERTLKIFGGYGAGLPAWNSLFPVPSVFFNANDGAGGGGEGNGEGAGNDDGAKGQDSGDTDNEGADGGEEKIPYTRFKKVNDEKNELKERLKKLEDQQAKAEAEKLAEEKKFQELAEKKAKEAEEAQKERDEAKAKLQNTLITNSLTLEAIKAGAPEERLPYILRSVERDGIEVDDNGKVIGADKAIKAFSEAVPEMFSGSGGSPGPGGRPPKRGQKTAEELAKEIREKRAKRKPKGAPDKKGPWDKY